MNVVLIETCLESGNLTLPEIKDNLRGKYAHGVSRAVISLLECRIGNVRAAAESAGCAHRDELCGAARQLVELRSELVQMLSAPVESE